MKSISPRIRYLVMLSPLIIVAAAVILFIVIHSIDLGLPDAPSGYIASILMADPGTARYTLTAIACALATTLAITIALVLIVVELTANRYTPELIHLFVEAKANAMLLGSFILTIIYSFYVANTIGEEFAPRAGIITCMVLMTVCLASVIPYIFFVLNFLDPANIITKLQTRAISSLQVAMRPGPQAQEAKIRFGQSLERITDIAQGSMLINESATALSGVWALLDTTTRYLDVKRQCPQQWFKVEPSILLGLSREYMDRIQRESSWVEVKVLRELATVFAVSLKGSPEVASAVAISARHVGEAALASGDDTVLELVVKHFNTFLRDAIAAGQKMTIYNLLDEYRILAQRCLSCPADLGLRVSRHWCYYARAAEAHGLTFIAETVAYDLKVLNEMAYEQDCAACPELLGVFLSLADALASKGYRRPLEGVYKMWLLLGAFYLSRQAETLKQQVSEALARADGDTLAQLGEELLSVTDPDFWEITDRGVNFDYVEPDLRPHLRELLTQLPEN